MSNSPLTPPISPPTPVVSNKNDELCEDMKIMEEKTRQRSIREIKQKNQQQQQQQQQQLQQQQQQQLQQELHVEIVDATSILNNNQQNHPSPLSSKSGTFNMQTPRAPVLSASDATQQTASFVRGVIIYSLSCY